MSGLKGNRKSMQKLVLCDILHSLYIFVQVINNTNKYNVLRLRR